MTRSGPLELQFPFLLLSICFLLFLVAGLAGAQTLELVSAADPPGGSSTANDISRLNNNFSERSFSADGRYLVFESEATDLVPGVTDTNGVMDIFLFDGTTGLVTLVSHVAGDPTTTADARSILPMISGDGLWVAYQSSATNLVAGQVDNNTGGDIFLRDRVGTTTQLASHVPGSTVSTGDQECAGGPSLDANGTFLSMACKAGDLVTGQINGNPWYDVFVYDRAAGTVGLASHLPASAVTTGNANSGPNRISADGSWVFFESQATDLLAGFTDRNGSGQSDVWAFDRSTGAVGLVSHPAGDSTTGSDGIVDTPKPSADGSWVLISSQGTDHVAGQIDTNDEQDLFLWERVTDSLVLVSHAQGSATTAGDAGAYSGTVTSDASLVAFGSHSTNLLVASPADGEGLSHIYLFDRSSGALMLVTHRPYLPGVPIADYTSFAANISDDGTRIVYGGEDISTNLYQVFVYDAAADISVLASFSVGNPPSPGNADSSAARVSSTGLAAAFHSAATDLVANDLNSAQDVFLYHLDPGPLILVDDFESGDTSAWD